MSCGVGRRRGSNPQLLWLWHRLAATAPIRPLAWEPPYAVSEALTKDKRQKKKKGIKIIDLENNQVICEINQRVLLPNMKSCHIIIGFLLLTIHTQIYSLFSLHSPSLPSLPPSFVFFPSLPSLFHKIHSKSMLCTPYCVSCGDINKRHPIS